MIEDLDNRWIWFNGELVQAQNAKIYALSPTAQFGLNVFEGIPVYYNKLERQSYVFRLEDHYRRLLASAKMMEICHDYTTDMMTDALFSVIKKNGNDEDIVVRQFLYVDGVGSWSSSEPVGMILSPIPRSKIEKTYRELALKCCFSSWRRINEQSVSPRIKSGANYINSRMGQREAIRNGYDTCIFLNECGTVSEGTGSCFFMIKDGILVTPELTDSVLNSITRDTIINLARDRGIVVEERSINRTEVYTCDEAFLCGSSMEIRSITSIDGFEMPDCRITNELHGLYKKVVNGEVNTHRNWIVPVR